MNKYIGFLILLLLPLASCVIPYDYTQNGIEKLLVVEGYISNDSGNSEIRLSYSNEFGARVFDLVDNAKVEIIENSYIVNPFTLKSPGVYVPVDTMFKADFQNIYKLHIEIDNKIYESYEVHITKAAEIDSVSFKGADKYRAGDKHPYRALDILVTTKDDINASKYYRYSTEETWLVVAPASRGKKYTPVIIYSEWKAPVDVTWKVEEAPMTNCWASSISKGIFTGATEGLIRNQLVNVPVFAVSLESPKLLYKYSVLVKQYSIPKVAYNFMDLMREFTDRSGSLYDIQPGFVDGNVRCLSNENEKVIGIFYATDITEKRIFIHLSDLIGSDKMIVNNYRPYCIYKSVTIPHALGVEKTTALQFMSDSLTGLGLVATDIYPFSRDADQVGFTNGYCADCRISGTNIKPAWWGETY